MSEQASNAMMTRYVTRRADIASGEPIIAGTRTPVRSIVEMWRLGVSPEEIPLHYPHLTWAQIYDGLSFYQDNMAEINGYIERNRVPPELIGPSVRKRFGP